MSKTLEELQTEATEKGVTFDGRWGKKRLQKKIKSMVSSDVCHAMVLPKTFGEIKTDIVEDEEPSLFDNEKVGISIKNLSPNKYEIFGFSIRPSEVIELSDRQLHDEKLMRCIDRHVEIGKFEFVK